MGRFGLFQKKGLFSSKIWVVFDFLQKKTVWAAIPQATLDKIAMGFKGAVEAVRRNNGACL